MCNLVIKNMINCWLTLLPSLLIVLQLLPLHLPLFLSILILILYNATDKDPHLQSLSVPLNKTMVTVWMPFDLLFTALSTVFYVFYLSAMTCFCLGFVYYFYCLPVYFCYYMSPSQPTLTGLMLLHFSSAHNFEFIYFWQAALNLRRVLEYI